MFYPILSLVVVFCLKLGPIHCSCITASNNSENGTTVDENAISDAILDFTLKQYKVMLDGSSKNIFTSPFSIWSALALTYLGSRGESSLELQKLLGLQGLEKGKVEIAMKNLSSNVLSESGDLFLMANKLAVSNRLNIRQCLVNEESLGIEAMDFANASEAARNNLNSWISSKTNHKIKELLPKGSIDTNTVLAIINAVYFQGSWKKKFNPKLTYQGTFYSANGDHSMVEMMERKSKHSMYTDEEIGFHAVDLPYSQGKYSMSILLPQNSIDTVMSKLKAPALKHMFNNFELVKSHLIIPKFKFQKSYELNEVLKKLGASGIFHSIDISGIVEKTGNTYVSSVLHEAFIEVNEKGTEAAAATSVLISSRTVEYVYSFKVNRPFICILREVSTNTILFLGAIYNI